MSDDLILSDLAKRGLYHSVISYRNNTTDDASLLRVEVVRNTGASFDIINSILDHVNDKDDYYNHFDKNKFIDNLFKIASDKDINLYSIPEWRQKIDLFLSAEYLDKEQEDSRFSPFLESFYDRATYILNAANMVPDYDWTDLFGRMYGLQRNYKYTRSSFRFVFNKLSDTKPTYFKEFAKSNIFWPTEKKPNYAVRTTFYRKYIELGFLDKKTVRKIRSDGSEDASMSGLKALIEHEELYSDYFDLLLQFSDSKYEGVLMILAKELPIHLLTSIMGTESNWVKQTIDKRLNQEEENNG
tara:strand:- start:1146 stop:2042 length:897 start_codon:yes stop_codon:yes gene_type:complete